MNDELNSVTSPRQEPIGSCLLYIIKGRESVENKSILLFLYLPSGISPFCGERSKGKNI